MSEKCPALPENSLDLVRNYLKGLQDTICKTFESIDGEAKFHEDEWQRPEGGGGRSRAMDNGAVFEKGGVNFSEVHGKSLPKSASASRPELEGAGFHAMGVSLVMHPNNPYIPTSHANVRFFMATKGDEVVAWWFGGGFDLTPYYGFKEDCIHWHQTAKNACLPFGEDIYPEFKAWCDDYFFLKHRNEARGIGGLFFDDYARVDFDHSFNLMKSIGDAYLDAYVPIIEKRKHTPFGQREKEFQSLRRGRYVEFNLIYDRGTLFGLQSGGRTESILISLPPKVAWKYQWEPESNTAESDLYSTFLPAQDWLKAEIDDC